MKRNHAMLFAVLTVSVATLRAQAPAAQALPSFEAISIRESKGTRLALQWQGPRLVGGELPLSTLLAGAYEIPFYQLADLPDWVRSARWEINAVASRVPTQAEQMPLLRVLLEDRFKVLARRDKQERPIYALVLARQDGRLGPGLRAAANDCVAILTAPSSAPRAPGGPQCRTTITAGSYVRDGIPIALLAEMVSTRLQRPVVDRTGLTGIYDIELRFRPAATATAPADTNEPDLVTALEEQLGLKAESTRASVEVTVFDRIERPALD